ncbi:beta-ketoacyl synthase N-terminal-like domain-containing protein [Micromonospora sp. FIMYZ51]|uniref:beta-ketoacyl synthase N-terminal-like domain-containing protein n=1 Tax=Micromonospora sp. FIMYZ51 TaxID=3051832 RepID=UPI00311E298D
MDRRDDKRTQVTEVNAEQVDAEQVDAEQVDADGPPGVAIIGMSCTFPAAPDLATYWSNILRKVDAVTDPPPQAWDSGIYYDPDFADEDKVYCRRGGYLGPLASFDPLAYGVPPVAVGGEPDQWLALRLARDALTDAGCTELPAEVRHRTAVVLGKGTYLNGGNATAIQRGLIVGQTIELLRQLHPGCSVEWLQRLRQELQRVLPPLGPDVVPGLIPNIIVGRIANQLDFMGPTYTVDAACASSLVAVQLAMRDLLAGECDLALAGGSQVWMPVPALNVFCRLGALSPTERILPFDEDADGTLLGEGIGMLVLKRVADAVRDGDRIYAVIRGVGVASDGHAVSVMAPRADGEELALRRAYQQAGVDPRTVGLIEAHGTATPLGDVVEVQALRRVFGHRTAGRPWCALGSVKSMISHTIPAAGVASLIKVALALHQKVLPPTLCRKPNPKLGLDDSPFYLNTETRPWVHGGPQPRRAGVNAFGFGGINAHAVLEEAPGEADPVRLPAWDSEVCVLESDSPRGLAELAAQLAGTLTRAPAPYTLTDVAYSLSTRLGRIERPVRLAVVATSLADLAGKLTKAARRLAEPDCLRIRTVTGSYFAADPLARTGTLAFLFPGEGAQYAGMLADLCLNFPQVREVFDRVDRRHGGAPDGERPSDHIFPRPAFSAAERAAADARLNELDTAVDAVLAANAALLVLAGQLGLRPDGGCLGHSSGEYSAAIATGVLAVRDEARLGRFAARLRALSAQARARDELPHAVLLVVATDRDRAVRLAAEAGGLHLAMDNCPHQVVLVGDRAATDRARELATRAGVLCDELPYDRAVHTPRFAPYAAGLRDVVADLEIAAAHAPLYSGATAAPYPTDPEEVRRLLVEQWVRPVEFRRTVHRLHADGARIFVEVGPRGNLTSFVEDILRGRPFCAVPADLPRRTGTTQLNHLVGILAAEGVAVDPSILYARRGARLVDLTAPEAPLTAHAVVPLATGWPMLRLPAEALAALADVPGGPATPVSTVASRPAAPARVAPPPRPGPARSTPPPGPTPAPAAAAAAPMGPVPAGRRADAVLAEHLTTMRRFLSVSEQVVRTYLGDPKPAGGGRQWRLLGTPVRWSTGRELVARRAVDPARDEYLRDHALGGAVSALDPGLRGLAAMPLTMSLEILAEAAARLVPGQTLVGLRDVRARTWLAWDDRPQTLEVSARRLAPQHGHERVEVRLRALDGSGPEHRPAVEGTVLFGVRHPQPPPALGPPPDATASRWRTDQLYTDGMFHGACWQGVAAMELTARRGSVGRLRVLPLGRLLPDAPEHPFLLDPVVLDAAGQVIGFWAAEQLDCAAVVFPYEVAGLDVCGPRPPVGTQLRCTARTELVGDRVVRSDIDVSTERGEVWLRLTGWADRRFELPSELRPLLLPPDRAGLSHPWPQPGLGDTATCRRVSAMPGGDRDFWLRVWATRVLAPTERRRFAALHLPAGRRSEWLAGRTAAKEAVAQLLADRFGIRLLPADIEVVTDPEGRPLVRGGWQQDVPAVPVVSITHTPEGAVAVATLPETATGSSVAVHHAERESDVR